MVFGYVFDPSHVPIFLTLILLEGVLAFDNAAILAAMVRKLPEHQRQRALYYGLAGAYAFRILAILGVTYLIRYPMLKVAGGAYLVYLAVKHLWGDPHKEHVEHSFIAMLGLSPFWRVVVGLELTDIAFAIDQVIVAVAFTDEIVLIVAASLIALLAMRLSAMYIGRLMDWFPQLERLAYIAVGFVGLKLVGTELVRRAGYPGFAVPKSVSIGVTLSLLVLPVIGKLILERIGPKPSP